MIGIGTIVNVIAVIIGGIIGIMIKNGLKPRFQEILMQGCGIATMFIGVSGALSGLLVISNNKIETSNTMLLIVSLVIGGIVGEAINIEKRMDSLGEKLKGLIKDNNDSLFVEGFVTTSLVICVGAMAIVGALEDGLTGDYSMLFSKAVLDFIIVMVFASTLGVGAVFSAIPLGIYQGLITISAMFVSNYINDTLIMNVSCVGSVLIFCVGINIVFKNKIKVGNLLPAVIVPVIISLFK